MNYFSSSEGKHTPEQSRKRSRETLTSCFRAANIFIQEDNHEITQKMGLSWAGPWKSRCTVIMARERAFNHTSYNSKRSRAGAIRRDSAEGQFNQRRNSVFPCTSVCSIHYSCNNFTSRPYSNEADTALMLINVLKCKCITHTQGQLMYINYSHSETINLGPDRRARTKPKSALRPNYCD